VDLFGFIGSEVDHLIDLDGVVVTPTASSRGDPNL
jgi:hypothetical protein